MTTLTPNSARFWTAQSSWYSSTLSAQAAAARSGVAKAERKEALWSSRGERYMRATGQAHNLVRVPPELQQDVLAIMAQTAPALAGAFDRHLAPLAQEAFDKWPESTGLSKSLLSLEYTVRGNTFTGGVYSRAPYTMFIRQSKKTPEERAKAKARGEAIRAAAAAAGKEDRLGSFKVESSKGGGGSGPLVVRVLLDSKAEQVAQALAIDGLDALAAVRP